MNSPAFSLWRSLPPDLDARLDRLLDVALDRRSGSEDRYIFFRADDVAAPSAQFTRLMDLFLCYRMPLCLAVVPAWLTKTRWEVLERIGRGASSLWCWHQHGWRHVNHEGSGKKQEFGPGRPLLNKKEDLIRGKERLETLLGKAFSPVLTPPWNRCDEETLSLLKELDYRAVSRFRGSVPRPPAGLPDLAVSVDLHTRKQIESADPWEDLFSEIEAALAERLCGIMIHHERMNEAAFVFLEIFLQSLVKQKRVQLVHFGAESS